MGRLICPQCGTELRIGATYNTVQDGAPYTVQQMMCANSRCGYNRAGTPVMVLKHRLEGGSVPEEYKLCCDTVLCSITDTAFFVPANIASNIAGYTLSVSCPKCQSTHSFNIGGKEQIS